MASFYGVTIEFICVVSLFLRQFMHVMCFVALPELLVLSASVCIRQHVLTASFASCVMCIAYSGAAR